MSTGQVVYIVSRLVLGAAAAFLAIMLWARIRDAAWTLVIIGALTAYAETVYSIVTTLGSGGESRLALGPVSLPSVLLHSLPTLFFTAAFAVMVARKYRRR